MRGSFKADPRAIIRAHYATYVDARTGRGRVRDHIEFAAPPVIALSVCLLLDVRLSSGASAGLLTATGLLGAFLFSAMLQVSQRAMDWADSAPLPGPITSSHARLLRELAANSGYASLACIAAAIAYVVSAISAPDVLASSAGSDAAVDEGSQWVLRASSAIGLALGVHAVQTLLMVMKRVFALTEERLNRAQAGADQEATAVQRRRAS